MESNYSSKEYFEIIRVESWDKLFELYNDRFRSKNKIWIFRGHNSCKYPLQSTLERTIEEFNLNYSEAIQYEKILLRKFQGCLHQYESIIPKKKNILEWWTYMRHYGAPTRLLDWTYSFFIAIYFALENASGEDDQNPSDAAVWALCPSDWKRVANNEFNIDKNKEIDDDPKLFKKLFFSSEPSTLKLVYPLNPLKLNDRLTLQQGLFLCPTISTAPFIECFVNTQKKGASTPIKIIIDHRIRKKALYDLYRMNITRAVLFPGLAGFAESLRFSLANPKIFKTIR